MVNAMIILVSIGTGLFKGNLNALIGRQYKNKELLDAAFSIQYSYVNLGAFIGSLLTGFLYLHAFKKGEVLGFRQCFFVAAIWCLVGMVWFVLNWKNLQGQGIKPFKYLTDENGKVIGETHKGDDKSGAKEPLTKLERNRVLAIILVSALSVIFWLFYYQQDLALVIYMTDYINMNLGSFAIAPSWITTTWNGLLCVALGGVMAAIWKKHLSLLMGVIAISTFGANKLSPFVQAFIEKFDVFPVFVGIFAIMLIFTALLFATNKKLNSLVEGEEE